ncbi:MAG: bifunctional diaminohydroxyphosphoribosylaminopyrimidine deaminase/5-amino-6-(5-phosphoribosylamino)uracil reductase RibD [Bacteroidota bacterium]
MESKSILDAIFLNRCCDLGHLAGPGSSPNPKVGAVLVYEGRIIGEGYHKLAGHAHAEVNCLASVKEADKHLIPDATIYISLEPCCFYGRTPACTDLILKSGIKKVVIGQLDQTPEVSGQGVDILRRAGIQVEMYPDHSGCRELAAERQVYVSEDRPYIILKWAQSADGFLAPKTGEKYWITSSLSRKLTHRWRAQTKAILVGAGTVLADDPSLTTRFYSGADPIRVIFDPKNRCRGNERVFINNSTATTLWFKSEASSSEFSSSREVTDPAPAGLAGAGGQLYKNVKTTLEITLPQKEEEWLPYILSELHQREINQLTVEGGAQTLNLFLKYHLWDEIRRLTGTEVRFGQGLAAPEPPPESRLISTTDIAKDQIDFFEKI